MRGYRESLQSGFVVASRDCRGSGLAFLALLLLLFWPAASAMAQTASTPPAQTQAPAASQPGASQTDTGNKPQSLGDAARAAKAQKDNSKAKRVYTGDDLAHIHGTISEVGNGSSGDRSTEDGYSGAASEENQSSAANKEAFWREKARVIQDQIAAVDQQIEQKKAEISKAGPARRWILRLASRKTSSSSTTETRN